MSRILALLALALLALPAGAASVYKCTDANGNTYYSERRCPRGQEAGKLNVPPPASSDEAAAPKRKSLDERIAEATDPVVKARLEIQKQECELAKTQLQRYESAPYLVQRQDDGSERRLSDEEAQAEKNKLRDQIKTRCE